MERTHIISLIISVMSFTAGFAQTVTSSILSKQRIGELFPESVCSSLDIHFPIVQVDHYTDKSGSYYCVLTESRDETFEDEAFGGLDTLNRKIMAVNIKEEENGALTKRWEINDFITKNKYADEDELSIWFWKGYTAFNDLDGDGLVDPLLVYGTRENFNYTGNGRVKIIIYHKGKKIAIRHQNGILDGQRETRVDPSFYELPQKMQAAVKQRMTGMEENRHTIFPLYWEKQMEHKKTYLADNY